MKLHRKIKKSILLFLDELPFDVLGRYMRSRVRVKPPIGRRKRIIFKIAETEDELTQAFALLQNTYLESGLVTNEDTKLRIQKYNLLPTTTVFIAVYKNKVVGTVSHILDSEFGLPLDSFVNISVPRQTGKRQCEISGLAVHKKWRSQRKGVFFPLVMAALHHSYDSMGIVQYYLISNLKGSLYYKHLFFGKPIKSDTNSYSAVENAEAYALLLDVNVFLEKAKVKYKSKKLYHNMYMLWTVFPWRRNMSVSQASSNAIITPLRKKGLQSFLKKNINKFKNVLTERERTHINNLFNIKKPKNNLINRKENRHLVNFYINFIKNGHLQKVKVNDISLSGFSLQVDSSRQVSKRVVGRFILDDGMDLYVKGKLIWHQNNRATFKITSINTDKWAQVIHNIESEELFTENKVA
jgi:hypothetical protein